jgi:transcriptional regulator with XRE-family HTH domain
MTRIMIIRKRLEDIIKNESSYNFGEILKALRISFGLARRHLENDLSINTSHLYCWEENLKNKIPDQKIVETLATYYDFPKEILLQKAKKRYPNMEMNL